MATPKKAKHAKRPQAGMKTAHRSNSAGRTAGRGAHTKRRSHMTENGTKERAEEIRRAGEATAEELRRTAEEFAKAASSFDLQGMSRAWTKGYLHGLEAFFFTQEQTEGLLKETVTQGIGSSQQILQNYEKWLEAIQDQAGAASPFIDWSRQWVRTVSNTTESIVKTAVDTTEQAFDYYENSLARPSRNYAINLNKTVMDKIVAA